MSDDFLPTTPVPPKAARDVARAYITLANSLAEASMAEQATAALRHSNAWLAYALALTQTEGSGG